MKSLITKWKGLRKRLMILAMMSWLSMSTIISSESEKHTTSSPPKIEHVSSGKVSLIRANDGVEMIVSPVPLFREMTVSHAQISLYKDELELKRLKIDTLLIDSIKDKKKIERLDLDIELRDDKISILEDDIDSYEFWRPIIVTASCIGGGFLGYLIGYAVGGVTN